MSNRVAISLVLLLLVFSTGIGVMLWGTEDRSTIIPSAAPGHAAADAPPPAVLGPAPAAPDEAAAGDLAVSSSTTAAEARAAAPEAPPATSEVDTAALGVSETPATTDAGSAHLHVCLDATGSDGSFADAEVELVRADPEDDSMANSGDATIGTAKVDETGCVRLTAAPGLLGLSARSPWGSAAKVYREFTAGEHEVTLKLHRHLHFVVSVRNDSSDEPMAGAPVEIQCRSASAATPRQSVKIIDDLRTGADGQVTASVAEDADLLVTVWMKGYLIAQKDFKATEAFGELRMVPSRRVAVKLPAEIEGALVSLHQGDRTTTTSSRFAEGEARELAFGSATAEPGRLVVDLGAPYAIAVIEVPAGGDLAEEFQPRTDGGAITLSFAGAFNGVTRILLDGTRVRGDHDVKIAAGESLVYDRLAPDLDYDVELFASDASGQRAVRVALGRAHVLPEGNTVMEVSSEATNPPPAAPR